MGKRKMKTPHFVLPEPPLAPAFSELKLRRRYVFLYCGRELTGKLKQKSKGGWLTLETEFEEFRVRSTAVRRLARS
jgi:hypothetical protein